MTGNQQIQMMIQQIQFQMMNQQIQLDHWATMTMAMLLITVLQGHYVYAFNYTVYKDAMAMPLIILATRMTCPCL